MIIKTVKRYVAECGKSYSTKRNCLSHEDKCTCWTNPKFKTCMTCKFGKSTWDSCDTNNGVNSWRVWECSNPNFKYNEHFTAAHEKAEDLCKNCPVWAAK